MFEQVSRLMKGEGSTKIGELVAKADAARDARAWGTAAQLYRSALQADPTMADIWVQFGHALKESGAYEEAEEAYRRSLHLRDTSDTHLQLGHLLKIVGRDVEAAKYYRRAFELMPDNLSIKREIEACEKNLGSKFYSPRARQHIYFDISDLIFYLGHHDNLTGIQRVQASIVLGLLELNFSDLSIHFLTYVNSKGAFFEIDQKFFVSLLQDLKSESESREIEFDRLAARDGYIKEAVQFKLSAKDENVLCLLGAAWVNRDYFLRLRNLKQQGNFRVLFLIHDLIPIYARETCDQGTAEVFTEFLLQSYEIVDKYICVSQSTKNDLTRYFLTLGRQIPEPVVTENGALVAEFSDPPPEPQNIDPELSAGNYILFVSTIEGRKNHITAFKAYQQILTERQDAPFLVCVGRLGWRAEEFLLACGTTEFLDGKIKILSDVSDIELVSLYKNCLFTIYPSLYEGWGLPVGESLAFGKACIASKCSSLPEVGREFVHYIDPRQPKELTAAIASYLDNPLFLAEAENKIATSYQRVEWKDVAAKVVDASLESIEQPVRHAAPVLTLGREYPIRLTPQIPKDLMGERMAETILIKRRRHFMPGLYTEEDYRVGQNVRLGEGWCEPEVDFTWARISNAGIAFTLADSNAENVVLYLAYRAADPCVGADLVVDFGSGNPTVFKLKSSEGYLAISGVRPLRSPKAGAHYWIRFKIPSSDELESRLRALDGRLPAFAIRSFLVLAEADIKSRLTILERTLT